MIAISEARRAGLLGRDNWIRNLIAGLVVAVVSIPLSMAFAIASGAKPEQGLYTAAVAAVVVSLFGGTRVQIAGPTGAFIVLLASITARYGMAGLQVATLFAGLILLVFGLTKLGTVIRFIPNSVILGFTAGVGITIWVGQWASFFGLKAVPGDHFHEKLIGLLAELPHLHPATTALGAASVLLIVLWPKLPVVGKVPGPLVALVAGTLVQSFAHLHGVATIGTAFGGVPTGLPAFHVPTMPFSSVLELVWPAFSIALLGSIESLLSATVADGMTGTRHDANQELVGQGLANMAAALFGGFAATGAIARTATNIRHGGNSPIAGIASSVVLVLMLVPLAPLACNVPLSVLAAVLFVVAFNMSNLAGVARAVRRAPKTDAAVVLITLLLTVFTDLIVAVNVGVILAMLNFMRRMASTVEVAPVPAETLAHTTAQPAAALSRGVLVYTIDGPFFFGAVQQFEAALIHTHTEASAIVVSLERVPFIDLSGLLALKDLIARARRRHAHVVLSCANDLVAERLEHACIAGTDGGSPAVTLAQALDAAHNALAA